VIPYAGLLAALVTYPTLIYLGVKAKKTIKPF